ncbi:superinfection immunity protein [Paraburkholderia sp. MMS20-SJTN17]|uniref:Superinfection immunity protein n=1 Tax=Paraburkholderia translucens TaxID=2886945 RepID=A0ABS8KH02_9BURK|nr:superinfection immunity protein [Paraburkholderia sp. MMS20-SJTN17]MCC8404076.1 superinfection immunity protein [Paraburkholderia sp. MMS20-SJTN17]
MEPTTGLVYLLIALVVYFMPAIVARYRKHKNASAITVLNLFAGWTGVGYLGALVWAFTANTEPAHAA